MPTKLLCPACETTLKAPAVLPRKIKCPRCGARFDPSEDGDSDAGGGSGPPLAVILGVCGGAALVLLLLIAVVVVLSLPRGKTPELAEANGQTAQQPPTQGPGLGQNNDQPGRPGANRPSDGQPKPPPPPPPQTPPANANIRWKSPLTAEQQEKVSVAIDRGVAYLKKEIDQPGPAAHSKRLGAVALAGLTLLACGVPADDFAVQKVLTRVRADAEADPNTYDISLCLLFLDRLDDKTDSPLIQTLALRLVAGQNQGGGWTYNCPRMTTGDQGDLLTLLERISPPVEQVNAIEGDDKGKVPVVVDRGKDPPPMKTTPGKRPTKLPSDNDPRRPEPPRIDVKALAVSKWEPGKPLDAKGRGGDNSNTQFALLAAWAAQRHGVPVGRCLEMVDARFRATQNADGTWGYGANTNQFADSMTCAGLLGLAVGRGLIRGEDAKKAAAGDPLVERAMESLGKGFDRMTAGPPRFAPGRPRPLGANAHGDLYYLWSVERVGVIYERQEIAGRDWYGWGAQALVETQAKDGNWTDTHAGIPDTCFALLFLKRANVATNLTERLKTINMLDRVAAPKAP